jgi:hypothetical protein
MVMVKKIEYREALIKIYGERNTGTNYLSKLIALNLDVKQIPGIVPKSVMILQNLFPGKELVRDIYFALTFHRNLGWKHSQVRSTDVLPKYSLCRGNITFLTITKNPYSWLLSLYRKPYHQYWDHKPDFDTFLTLPWKTLGRDNVQREFVTPVEMWNNKNASYIQLGQEFKTINLRYEDVLSSPKNVIELISEASGCKWKNNEFVNQEQSTKEGEKNYAYYLNYYLKEKWKDDLSQSTIQLINEQLDDGVMNYFKYEKLY